MAEKTTKKTDKKASASESKKSESKASDVKERKQADKEGLSTTKIVLIAVVVIGLILLLFFFVVLPGPVTVPFSTFKTNLDAASRVAVILTYGNQTQFVEESQCAAQIVQVMAHLRNATTIDFYIMNNTLCTYPVGGLGHTVTIANATPTACLGMVDSEPSVFLNYSASNSSIITAYRLYVKGN